jgi:nicotinate dehydrogenase subunit B
MTAADAPTLLPPALQQHPRLGQWLRVCADGRIEARTGKVDIGQGIGHALRLIVSAELGLDPDQIVMRRANTRDSPDEGVTSGSLSVQHSGAALRCASSFLREICRSAFARKHGVPAAQVLMTNGRFELANAPASARYADLLSPADLERPIESVTPIGSLAARHAELAHMPRPELAAIVFGQFRYLQDIALPNMCHGLVLRPAVQPATLRQAEAHERITALRALDGIEQVLQDGLLIGLLASSSHALGRALVTWERWEQHTSCWQLDATAPPAHDMAHWLRSQPLDTTCVLDQSVPDDLSVSSTAATIVHQAEYTRPYLQHASIGLCCAIAQWSAQQDGLQVWSHSQSIFNLQRDLALAWDLSINHVQVAHVEGAGCYGHNGADDVAWDAAWLARAASDRPVRVQWTRAAELGHAPLGPAMLVRVRGAMNAEGRLTAWEQDVWSQGHGTRPGRDRTPALLGAWQTASPFAVPMAVNAALAAGGGSERNAVPPYDVPSVRVHNHRVLAMPLRVSALRALGAHANVFAAESFMDEMAERAGQDPLQFRLAHLAGPDRASQRARAVIQRVAQNAAWHAGKPLDAPEGFGRGIAYARYKNTGAYCAVIAQVEVTEAVHLRQLWVVADVGCVVHRDGALNQIEGGALQAASWTLHECAHWGNAGIVSQDWERYPIARFTQQPRIEVDLSEPPDEPSLGAGECAAGPVAGALANAVYDAIGVRMRSMPLTFERLLACAHAT